MEKGRTLDQQSGCSLSALTPAMAMVYQMIIENFLGQKGGRRSALVAIGSLVAGVGVARWLVPSREDATSSKRSGSRKGQAANPWGVSYPTGMLRT